MFPFKTHFEPAGPNPSAFANHPAYIAMAYIVMAYIVMAYTVMVYMGPSAFTNHSTYIINQHKHTAKFGNTP